MKNEKLKLNQLVKNELKKHEMISLKGGACPRVGCTSGPSGMSLNQLGNNNANKEFIEAQK